VVPNRERAKAVGIFNSGTCASFFLAPLLIGYATAHYGWRAAFIATGSMGMLWLIAWLSFPYNRLRRGSTQTQANLEADFASQTKYGGNIPLLALLKRPGTYAFAIARDSQTVSGGFTSSTCRSFSTGTMVWT